MQNYSSKRKTLPISLRQILPLDYEYQLVNYNELMPIITVENVKIEQIIVDLLTNINTKEDALIWLNEFQECSKTTIRLTCTYLVKEDKVIFRELRYCIHSNLVKQKNNHCETKNLNGLQNRDTGCKATLNLQMKKPKKFGFEDTYLFEINLRFIHNYVPNSASSLSFRPVGLNVQKHYIELFNM
ncbi:30929_t:CDS:1, partial [Racocetra persica]